MTECSAKINEIIETSECLSNLDPDQLYALIVSLIIIDD